MTDPLTAAAEYGIFLFSTICHEAAHAFSAKRLGDATAERGGQLSLNPLPHIRREPFGMVVVPLLGLLSGGILIGWASTPYSRDWARDKPHSAALMALAGPLANLSLLLLAALLIRAGLALDVFSQAGSVDFTHVAVGAGGPWSEGGGVLVSALFSMNLLLCIFNLLPIAPLDGAAALALIPGADGLSAALRSGRVRMIGLLAAWYLFPHIYGPVHLFAINLLFPGSNYH